MLCSRYLNNWHENASNNVLSELLRTMRMYQQLQPIWIVHTYVHTFVKHGHYDVNLLDYNKTFQLDWSFLCSLWSSEPLSSVKLSINHIQQHLPRKDYHVCTYYTLHPVPRPWASSIIRTSIIPPPPPPLPPQHPPPSFVDIHQPMFPGPTLNCVQSRSLLHHWIRHASDLPGGRSRVAHMLRWGCKWCLFFFLIIRFLFQTYPPYSSIKLLSPLTVYGRCPCNGSLRKRSTYAEDDDSAPSDSKFWWQLTRGTRRCCPGACHVSCSYAAVKHTAADCMALM